MSCFYLPTYLEIYSLPFNHPKAIHNHLSQNNKAYVRKLNIKQIWARMGVGSPSFLIFPRGQTSESTNSGLLHDVVSGFGVLEVKFCWKQLLVRVQTTLSSSSLSYLMLGWHLPNKQL